MLTGSQSYHWLLGMHCVPFSKQFMVHGALRNIGRSWAWNWCYFKGERTYIAQGTTSSDIYIRTRACNYSTSCTQKNYHLWVSAIQTRLKQYYYRDSIIFVGIVEELSGLSNYCGIKQERIGTSVNVFASQKNGETCCNTRFAELLWYLLQRCVSHFQKNGKYNIAWCLQNPCQVTPASCNSVTDFKAFEVQIFVRFSNSPEFAAQFDSVLHALSKGCWDKKIRKGPSTPTSLYEHMKHGGEGAAPAASTPWRCVEAFAVIVYHLAEARGSQLVL